MTRWPVIPTIIAALAVAVMIGLGVWQLQRKGQKDALLLVRICNGLPAVTWPVVPDPQAPLVGFQPMVSLIRSSPFTVQWAGKDGFEHVASPDRGAEGTRRVAIGGRTTKSPNWEAIGPG